MASFGGAFKRAALSPSRSFRSSMQRQTPSSSSELSSGSEENFEDPFAFSAENTPSTEQPPLSRPAPSLSCAATSALQDRLLVGKQAAAAISEPLNSSRLSRSKPIAIELPTLRKPSVDPESACIDTPLEPLSARGDVPGGYFPYHEDPKSRVRRPHPFHLDASKAKLRSLNRAAEPTTSAPPFAAMPEPSKSSPTSATMSDSHTPVSSYLPIGVHDSAALPMGKYYPSNYERRHGNSSQQRLKPQSGPLAAKPESQVPRLRHEPSHARSNSEVKRRLLQYQRDMVAQAAVATNALLNKVSSSGRVADVSALAGGLPLPTHIQLGETIIKTHKPLSPRLAPLGSPGPVTPMSLESSGEGYLTLGRAISDTKPGQQVVETARTIRVEQERLRFGDKGSPAAERGPPISV